MHTLGTTRRVFTIPGVRGSFDNPVARQALNGWEVSGRFRSRSGMPVSIPSNGNLFGGRPLRFASDLRNEANFA
jgi:hypothetical protein